MRNVDVIKKCAFILVALTLSAMAEERPNFLFVLVDDLGCRDLGVEGSWSEDHGFQINKGGWTPGFLQGGYYSPWINPRLESGPDGESLTLRLAEETAPC
jgi:hypothetical protein